MPHWRRLGKLFVSGQPRETSPPSQQWQGRGAGREVVSPYPALTWGEDYPANALGNPFAPMSGGCFPGPTFGRGYGPLGSPGRGRGGQEARSQEVGEVLLSEEGQGDNTAYTGRLGR